MAQKEKLIEGMQNIITMLSQAADGHAIQSKIFEAQGFSKLAEKYAGHATEEREFVERFIARILDLDGEVKNEAKEAQPVYTDPVEWIKYDTKLNVDGLPWVAELTEAARDDYATFDLLKEYYMDEEEDMLWGQGQLELIECIGKQNWLIKQL